MFSEIKSLPRHLALLLTAMVALIASAQTELTAPESASAETEDPTAATKKYIPSAWTLATPLGLHEPSTIDTLAYNYQRRAIPSMVTDAYATTGNIGGEGLDMIWFRRPDSTPFFFIDALRPWLPWADTQKFYNVYKQMTLVGYDFAGTSDNHLDRLTLDFAGNVNRRIGIGASGQYLISKGSYSNQAAKDFNFGLSGYYMGDRYEMQAFYNHYDMKNQENGGITDPLYITDPAELQGGVSSIQPKSIPVNLTAAQNHVNGQQLFMTHAFKLGYWNEEQVNDTLTRDVYVPVMKFIYSLDLQTAKREFVNNNRAEGAKFWNDTFYLTPDNTQDLSYYTSLTNTLGLNMIEGFQKWAQFGLSAYASFEYRRFKQTTGYALPELTEEQLSSLTPLPAGVSVSPKHSENILWVGGRLERQRGRIVNYMADVRFGLSDRQAGNIDLKGRIDTHIPLFGDTVNISATGRFRNETPSWLLQEYISNHFAWKNSFGKIRSARVGGRLDIPWTRTSVSVDFENIQNRIYFTPESLPAQYAGSVQVFSAALRQNFKVGILRWDNTVTYQATSNADVLPLPALAVYSNLYLQFTAFKVLHVQFGVDCDYYTRYRGIDFQPATMSFHNESETPVGNFMLCNAYVNFKLYKTRFYVLVSHVNRGWFSKDYFSMPLYPVNPLRFQLGLAVDFAN